VRKTPKFEKILQVTERNALTLLKRLQSDGGPETVSAQVRRGVHNK
jgi:hypothetical protein